MKHLIKKLKSCALLIGVISVAGTIVWTACRDENLDGNFVTSDLRMIYSYIVEVDPSMSMFLDIAEKIKFAGTLQAYGKYTCFIPTNDGVMKYLREIDKSSIDELSDDDCFTIMKYHIISMPSGIDSLTSVDFVDGRLPIPNMMAKYLTIRTVQSEGKIALEVNRRALILERDIKTENGYIQKIDNVLIPPNLTVGEQIMALSDDYSIYKSVMNKTGWIDSLSRNRDSGVWWTAFIQSNEMLASAGIENEDDLLATLHEARADIGGENVRNPIVMETKEDSLLWTFAAYQVIKSLNYVVDLTRASALLTCAPNQPMTFQLKKDVIFVNEFYDASGAVVEAGAPINRLSDYTDLSCYNGVLVELSQNPERTNYIGPVVRMPSAVYWDVCSQPEWRSHPNYTKANIDHIDTREMSEIWCYNANDDEIDAPHVNYLYNVNQGDAKWQVVNHDYMNYRVRNFAYMDFKMPLLIEGVYNLWTCVRRDPDPIQNRVQFYIIEEGQPEQKLKAVDLYFQYADRVKTMEDMINYGAKRYVAKTKRNESFSLLCGTFEVKTTGRHILRLHVVNQGTADRDSFLDMFHFIPVDDDQYWPRFDRAGKMVWPDTPCEEIFPYEATGCDMNET